MAESDQIGSSRGKRRDKISIVELNRIPLVKSLIEIHGLGVQEQPVQLDIDINLAELNVVVGGGFLHKWGCYQSDGVVGVPGRGLLEGQGVDGPGALGDHGVGPVDGLEV